MIESRGERAFTLVNNVVMLLVVVVFLYPFLNVLAISFDQGQDALRGGISIWPRAFSTEAYGVVFRKTGIVHAAFVSVARTAAGIATGLFATALLGYILAQKELLFRRFFIFIFIIPMYFSGGIIPMYILIRQLGLINNFLVYLIPPLIVLWNVMIMRSFFETFPTSIVDSARIDGSSEFRIFMQMVLPLSKPVLACIALFIGVQQWNSWFDTYIYTSKDSLLTLQGILVRVLWERQANLLLDVQTLNQKAQENVMTQPTPQTVQMAIIVITTVPIVMIYPLLQKYFVQGVMIGAVKG